MTKLILVHNWQTDAWYIADNDTPEKPHTIQPCQTREQLRWQIGHIEIAVNGKVTVIDIDGKEVEA